MLIFVSIYYNRAPLPVNSPLKLWCPLKTFDLIKDNCGDVCNTTIGPSGHGKYYDVVKKNIDCNRFFSDDFIEGWEQPKDIAPPDLESMVLASFPFFASIVMTVV